MLANTIALMFNGLTLTVALAILILLLGHDPRNRANQYFALFLFMMVTWASGSLLARAAASADAGADLVQFGLRLLDIGFAGAGISVYIYSVVVGGYYTRYFRYIAVAVLGVTFVYQVLLLAILETPRAFEIENDMLRYDFDSSGTVLYLSFQIATLVLVLQTRRKLRSWMLTYGMLLFSVRQILAMVSPQIRMWGGAEDVSAIAALMMSYAVVKRQILAPLLGRARQLDAVRDVSLAVASRLRLQDTLSAIAYQATELLSADGAAIFLKEKEKLSVAAVCQLSEAYIGTEVAMGQGVVGTVAVEQQGRRLGRYKRDWKGTPDLPDAEDRFGAVAAVPLIFAQAVVGVLFVVHRPRRGVFDREDMHLLELLGPQAAVAITNSSLFEAERDLSYDLAVAKDQFEVVLSSTQNPVIAVDRKFQCIFGNRAAEELLVDGKTLIGKKITELVSPDLLPPSPLSAARDLRQRRVHVYAVALDERTYLCHVAVLGQERPEGWVVVMNDVTQLKELDRLKSQMIQMTTHDLKNPIQAAMSYLELVLEDGEGVFTGTMQDDLNMVWLQLERMERLIKGILDLESVQSKPPRLEVCAIEEVLGGIVADAAAYARKRQITLELDIKDALPSVMGDAQQLSQVFANLVENALKFTPSGGW
ncbi:MAG: GAF domain-containing protein, partial [Anaerolineae bacterium]|nr:GAF domain-containing protein [Anaerolineae bacterium]